MRIPESRDLVDQIMHVTPSGPQRLCSRFRVCQAGERDALELKRHPASDPVFHELEKSEVRVPARSEVLDAES